MQFTLSKIVCIFLLLLCFSCSYRNENLPFNLFGNSARTCSYEQNGRFWTGISSLEKVNCSDTTGFISYPLSLKDNVFVSSTTNGFVVCFKHSNLVWEYKLEDGEYLISNLVASPNQDIFFVTNKMNIYKLSSKGERIWKKALQDSSKFFSILLATKTAFYFTTSYGKIYKVDYSGKIVWFKQLPLISTNCFAEVTKGKIVLNLTHDRLGETDTVFCLDTNGALLWKKYFDKTRLVRTPVIWNDKLFIIGYKAEDKEFAGVLFCLDTLGNTLWKQEFGIVPRYLSISNSGELFLVLYNTGIGETVSTIYKLDTTGNIVAKQHITSVFYSPLFISEQIIGAIGYTKGNPVMVFFGKDLTLWKTMDLSKYPSILNIPAVLDDCTMFFVSTSGNFLVRIDENPVIKLLPW